MDALQPDVLVVNEMTSQVAVGRFNNNVLNPDEYGRTIYTAGFSRDVVCYFRKALFEQVSSHITATDGRDIMTFGLKYLKDPNAPVLYLSGIHLKAGSEYAVERGSEIVPYVDMVTSDRRDDNVLLCGDLNVYGAGEPAYQALLTDSLFYDPLDATAEWHADSKYAYLHTQSTRYGRLSDDGSYGGMDDRFDFILASRRFNRPSKSGWTLLDGSYKAYGQDGGHYRKSVNYPANSNKAVPVEVADALYYASDHLPVTVQLLYQHSTDDVRSEANPPSTPALVNAYPNPFNGTVTIEVVCRTTLDGLLTIYNLEGQTVENLAVGGFNRGLNRYSWAPKTIPAGVYWAVFELGGTQLYKQITLLK